MGMVAYVGSLGSGKTWAVCRAVIGLALAFPGSRWLLGRHHSTDLRDTTQTEFFRMIAEAEEAWHQSWDPDSPTEKPPVLGDYKYVRNEYTFTNGAVVLFRTLEDAERRLKSLNIHGFGIDEASEVTEDALNMAIARARLPGAPNLGFLVSNPTSTRHWLYDRFVKSPRPHHVILRTNTLENVEHLPPGYVERLRAQYPADWVRRYLDGEWGLESERRVFPGFRMDLHVGPVEFDPRQPLRIGIDFGFQTPGVVWTQTTESGSLHVLRTWAPRMLTATGLADGIRYRTQDWFPLAKKMFYFSGTDKARQHAAAEKSEAEIFRAAGMPVSARWHHLERAFGIMRQLMELRNDGRPRLRIDANCRTLIEGFETGYCYAKDKDVPAKGGIFDPLMDALRYVVVGTFGAGAEVPTARVVSMFKPHRPGRPPAPWPIRRTGTEDD